MRAPTTAIRTLDVDSLTSAVKGTVSTPEDPAYDAARHAWNVTIDHRPQVIVEAETVGDVQAAIRFARDNGLPVTVQTTGHGQPKTCTSGVLLRMGRMRSVQIDRERRTARVGGGAVWGDVIGPAFEHGLAPISGSSPGVGVVGYLTGGGYGLMSRKYGLSIDNLISATVVQADGSVVTASEQENQELFWAIRGGGGAFGVIAELEIGLVPHAHVFGGNVMFDARQAPRVLKAWSDWTSTAPEAVTSALVLITFPPVPFVPEFLQGRSMVIFVACSTSPQEEAEAALRPMRGLEGAEFDNFRWMPYTESASIYNDPVDPLPVIGNGILLREFGEDAIAAFLKGVGPIPESPNLMIQIRHLGGAIGNSAVSATPMGDRRQAQYLAYWLGIPMPHNPPERIASHATSGIAALRPWSYDGAPLNWVGEADIAPKTIENVYDEVSFAKLIEVKKRVDPTNLFSSAGVGICLNDGA